jgi:hypothetical protein
VKTEESGEAEKGGESLSQVQTSRHRVSATNPVHVPSVRSAAGSASPCVLCSALLDSPSGPCSVWQSCRSVAAAARFAVAGQDDACGDRPAKHPLPLPLVLWLLSAPSCSSLCSALLCSSACEQTACTGHKFKAHSRSCTRDTGQRSGRPLGVKYSVGQRREGAAWPWPGTLWTAMRHCSMSAHGLEVQQPRIQ